MLGYIVPAVVLAATFLGAQLAFQNLALTLIATAAVALLLPYGDLRGKPPLAWLIGLPKMLARRRRRGFRRHRYYSP